MTQQERTDLYKRISYESFVDRKKLEYGEQFDPSDLNEAFAPYLHTDVRLEVAMEGVGRLRGFVGVTTGWKPSFILLRTKRSRASSYLLDRGTRLVREIHSY